MYGFDAIATHNGWAMAAVGASIVFAGLIILSALISQLHKLANLFERRKQIKVDGTEALPAETIPQALSTHFDADTALTPFRAASATLGESFKLADLHQVARRMDLPHPHLTLSAFRQKGELIDDGTGLFRWR